MTTTSTVPAERKQAAHLAEQEAQTQKTATESHPDANQQQAQDQALSPSDVPSANQTVADRVARAFRIVDTQEMVDDLRRETIQNLDELLVTLEVAKRWCEKDNAADHLEQVRNSISGALDQAGRVRSRLGSTQNP